MANFTAEAVPAARRGRLGTQRQRIQAPADALSDCATAPATNAQYPHPAQASRIEAATIMNRLTMSLAETTEKRMARLRRARCRTEVLVKKIVAAMPAATGATCGLL